MILKRNTNEWVDEWVDEMSWNQIRSVTFGFLLVLCFLQKIIPHGAKAKPHVEKAIPHHVIWTCNHMAHTRSYVMWSNVNFIIILIIQLNGGFTLISFSLYFVPLINYFSFRFLKNKSNLKFWITIK